MPWEDMEGTLVQSAFSRHGQTSECYCNGVKLSIGSKVCHHVLDRTQFFLFSRYLDIIGDWQLGFFLLLDFFEKLVEHIIHFLIVRVVVHHIAQQIVDFVLTNFGLLSVQNEVLQSISILRLLLQLPFHGVEGFDGFHVHQGLLQLELLLHQDLLPEGVVFGLLLHLSDFLYKLLCLFFLVGSKQFLGLFFEDFYLIFKPSFLFFKVSDLGIQVIECGFNLEFFLGIFIFLGGGCLRRSSGCGCWFRFSSVCAKEPLKEVHYDYKKYDIYLYQIRTYTI